MLRSIRQGRWWTAWKSAVAVLGIAGAPAALAGKPGGTPALDGVAIYYFSDDLPTLMLPDGSGKAAHAGTGTPSVALHGGQRVWIRWEQVALHSTGEGTAVHRNPGADVGDLPRFEVFATAGATRTRLTECVLAVDGDGNPTQFVEPDIAWQRWQERAVVDFHRGAGPFWARRNGFVDRKVYFVGRTWTKTDGTWSATGGVYAFDVDPDAFASTPVAPMRVLDLPFWSDGTVYTAQDYRVASNVSYAPDGVRMVTDRAGGLLIVSAEGGTGTEIASDASFGLEWSPVDDRIVYRNVAGGISVVGADGTGRKVVLAKPSKSLVELPTWSPAGTWILYKDYTAMAGSPGGQLSRSDVRVVPSTGGSPVNLTGDVSTWCVPHAWR